MCGLRDRPLGQNVEADAACHEALAVPCALKRRRWRQHLAVELSLVVAVVVVVVVCE